MFDNKELEEYLNDTIRAMQILEVVMQILEVVE